MTKNFIKASVGQCESVLKNMKEFHLNSHPIWQYLKYVVFKIRL